MTATRTRGEPAPIPHRTPHGSRPTDAYAATQHDRGQDAKVVMDRAGDQFLVVPDHTPQ
ncbi:hypothetical protein OG897_40185 [Streptomyces sp. NBC_00237]|uniref:hypothetical protein n=1 Tax=Streptomyces sp. NBC_00237 TaxID=2975687 RepID=UPI00224D2A9C|nr:hypothetical protein [Streptomyces sp. NBC_00237]MCX5207612.1 hypothetical protein [Streptomyces sp. NBC_00237]